MTIVLTLIGWAFKNWKLMLYGAAVILVLGFLRHIDQKGYQRRINEEKAQEIALLTERIAKISFITSLDTQRALTDSKLTKQLESLAFETPPNAGACLDRAAAGRVRSIQLPDPFAAPTASRRHSSLFQKRSERP